jgi:hypothetical protein
MKIFLGSHRRILLALLAIASLFVVTVFSVHAEAHAQTTAHYCTLVLDHLHPGETQSRVLSSHCSSQPQMQPRSGTLLMRAFVDAGYGGSHYDFTGAYGPCDASGYSRRSMPSGWNDTISSFQVFNHCTYTRVYKDNNFGGGCALYSGNVSYVGDFVNDQLSSFRIGAARYSC